MLNLAKFNLSLPACEICRLEWLNSPQAKAHALKIYKVPELAFKTFKTSEQGRLLLRCLTKLPSRLVLCKDIAKRKEHKALLRAIRQSAACAVSKRQRNALPKDASQNRNRSRSRRDQEGKKDFEDQVTLQKDQILRVLRYLNVESLPEQIRKLYETKISELERARDVEEIKSTEEIKNTEVEKVVDVEGTVDIEIEKRDSNEIETGD